LGVLSILKDFDIGLHSEGYLLAKRVEYELKYFSNVTLYMPEMLLACAEEVTVETHSLAVDSDEQASRKQGKG